MDQKDTDIISDIFIMDIADELFLTPYNRNLNGESHYEITQLIDVGSDPTDLYNGKMVECGEYERCYICFTYYHESKTVGQGECYTIEQKLQKILDKFCMRLSNSFNYQVGDYWVKYHFNHRVDKKTNPSGFPRDAFSVEMIVTKKSNINEQNIDDWSYKKLEHTELLDFFNDHNTSYFTDEENSYIQLSTNSYKVSYLERERLTGKLFSKDSHKDATCMNLRLESRDIHLHKFVDDWFIILNVNKKTLDISEFLCDGMEGVKEAIISIGKIQESKGEEWIVKKLPTEEANEFYNSHNRKYFDNKEYSFIINLYKGYPKEFLNIELYKFNKDGQESVYNRQGEFDEIDISLASFDDVSITKFEDDWFMFQFYKDDIGELHYHLCDGLEGIKEAKIISMEKIHESKDNEWISKRISEEKLVEFSDEHTSECFTQKDYDFIINLYKGYPKSILQTELFGAIENDKRIWIIDELKEVNNINKCSRINISAGDFIDNIFEKYDDEWYILHYVNYEEDIQHIYLCDGLEGIKEAKIKELNAKY